MPRSSIAGVSLSGARVAAKAEQASRAVHQILEHVGEGFVALDREWRYTFVNQKAADMLGRNGEDLMGAHVWTEFPEAVGGAVYGALNKALATQRPVFVEEYFEPWARWFENRIYPSETGLSIFFTEITERKRAEAALEQAQQERERLHRQVEAEKRRLEQLAACVPAGILMAEAPSGRVVFSNHRVTEWLGDPVSRHTQDLLAGVIATGVAVLDQEIECVGKDGARLTLLVSAVPVRDESGNIEAAIASFHDVSERRLARDALRQLSHRLLAAQEEERHRISQDLHDDLGQVLTAIKMSLGSIARRVKSRALEAAVANAIESVDRGLAWTRDLSIRLHPPILDLLGLEATLRCYLEDRRWDGPPAVHLSLELSETRLSRAIETACFRVTQEAVTNALRHAHARNVWVEVREMPGALLLSVRDDGRGFDVSAARAQAAAGTSIGLSGMRERVALAHGRLDVRSSPGAGTQLSVRFPMPPAASLPQCPSSERGDGQRARSSRYGSNPRRAKRAH